MTQSHLLNDCQHLAPTNLALLTANKRHCSDILKDSKGGLNGVSRSNQSQLFKV